MFCARSFRGKCMKMRLLIVASFGLLAFQLPTASAFQPPQRAPLSNYDKRLATATPVAEPDADAQQAEAALKARLPALRVARDRILGTPRLVTATRGFLTGPGGKGKALVKQGFAASDDPHDAVRNFLNEHAALFGHDANVLATASVKRDYITAHNGLHTVIWEQSLEAIPVFEGLLTGQITRNGELVSVSSHFVPEL